MKRIRQAVGTYGFDALVVLLTITGMLELLLDRDVPSAPRITLWIGLPAIALIALPLLARRRFPLEGPALLWVLAAGVSFLDGRLVPFATSVFALGMAASFLLGSQPAVMHARLGLAIAIACAALVIQNKPDHSTSDLVFTPLLFGICAFAGFALRERAREVEAADLRAAQAERERDAAARVAVAEERTRIARELHDIVAHAMSVMVLQVGAVRSTLPETLAEQRGALVGVEQSGRTALAEMRRLLAAMRLEGEDVEFAPQPGLDRLEALLQQVRTAGLPVHLHVEGERAPLPQVIDLSAYRIIQEGLTNVLKHAGASRADVTLRFGANALCIEVSDDGRGASLSAAAGHGLVGIRERVKVLGGEMTAGTAESGGYSLITRLPLKSDAR